jgi:arylsulfatase
LVVRWPAVIRQRGEFTNQVGHVIDIMATCLDAAGEEYPTEVNGRKPLPLEGKSLLPILQGRQRQEHEVLCWSLPQHQAIRMGRWKAIRLKRGGSWQLFDLEADGTETVDLARGQPQRTEELASQFEVWRDRVGAQ